MHFVFDKQLVCFHLLLVSMSIVMNFMQFALIYFSLYFFPSFTYCETFRLHVFLTVTIFWNYCETYKGKGKGTL